MKLYTEEQLRNSMLSMKTYIQKYHESVIDSIIEKHIKALGVVELPSDEEIIAKSKQEPDNSDIETAARIGYVAGAKWMRDKIQGGNK